MKVEITDLNVTMELGNDGIVLAVYDNANEFRGKLRIGKATVEWCEGKIQIGNGVSFSLSKVIDYFEHVRDTHDPHPHLTHK
jgi:hypothetical protein